MLSSPARAWAMYAGGMALVLAPFALLIADNYWINILAFTYLMAGLASAWNIIGGFGGQFSAAHGVFFGIGAYVTARLYCRRHTLATGQGVFALLSPRRKD